MGESALTLSIVSATYRDPVGLRRTLASLAPLRERSGWEHIVVDSSPEETRPVLLELPPEHPLRVVGTPPRGIYAAMNEGLDVARGEWVWFLNGGDCAYEPQQALAALHSADRGGGIDGIVGGARYFRDHQYAYTRFPSKPWWRGLLGSGRFCQQAIILKREIFGRLGKFSESYSIAGDYEFHMRCWAAGATIVVSPDVLCEHQLGGRSDDYRQAFAEARQVQRSYSDRLSPSLRIWNTLEWHRQLLRIRILRLIADSRWGKRLRPVWWRLQRARRPWGPRRTGSSPGTAPGSNPASPGTEPHRN